MSKELQTLILAYRVLFLDLDKSEFKRAYADCKADRLMKLASYHAVRPVLYQALRKAEIIDALTLELQSFATQIAMRDKIYGIELARLLKLLNENGILALPYKGYLFTEKLYKGQHFRESGDMDLVIRNKSQAEVALKLLMNEGYNLEAKVSIQELLDNAQGREVSLIRLGQTGLSFHLDFHWGVNETYHEYLISTEDFFEGFFFDFFSGVEVLNPCTDAIFKMLLNHHGGRNCWLRLKEVFDFSLFLTHFPNIENRWDEVAKKMKMATVYQAGNRLNEILLSKNKNIERYDKTKKTIKWWEEGTTIKPGISISRVRYFKIYLSLQDQRVSHLKILWNYILFIGGYFPSNHHKYYRPFKGRSNFLNFLIKSVTILYRKARGTYGEK